MHREIQNQIEEVLGATEADARARRVSEHLNGCAECRDEIGGMRDHAALLQQLRAPAGIELEPRPGFYARVLQRIEEEGPVSIWNLFIESAFGRRIALASLALALLLGVYVISSERAAQDPILASQPVPVMGEDAPGRVITQMDQSIEGQTIDGQTIDGQASADAVLANLVTYNEQ
jgi:hypothetical protein